LIDQIGLGEMWSRIRNWLVVRCQLRQVCVWLPPHVWLKMETFG